MTENDCSSKTCRWCGNSKPIADFYQNGGGHRRPECKTCTISGRAEYNSRPDVVARKRRYSDNYRKTLTADQKARYAAASARCHERTPRQALALSRSNAMTRRPGTPFISIEELFSLWRDGGGLCAISGIRMTWRQGRILPTSISLDRIDSDRGYEPGNVRLVCYSVNAFRNIMSDEQMLEMARAIVTNMESQRKLKVVS